MDRLLLVLDEFPYLAEAAPSLTSVRQAFVDHEMSGSLMKVVLAGSHITAMRRLEAADQPLHARRTARLRLAPFDCRDASRFVAEQEPANRLRTYAAFGGVPGHLALLRPDRSFPENVARGILDPSSRLHDEAQHMLDAFLGGAEVHYSILDAIAAGEQTWSGITRYVGKRSDSLSRPMAWLLDMEIVRRVVPVSESAAARSKRTIYRIDDPYVRFWHRFVAPLARAGVDPGARPELLFETRVRPHLDGFLGPAFEDACRSFVRRSGRIPFEPMAIGEWWSRTSDARLDVVALSGEGPSDSALRAAIASGEVLHFGLKDLYEDP